MIEIVKQKAEVLNFTPDILNHIENCARTAYQSHDKSKNNPGEFIKKFAIKMGHESILDHAYISVRFNCSRGISAEINRHKFMGITQESTRYCQYKDKISVHMPKEITSYISKEIFKDSCLYSFVKYKQLLELGEKPQNARDALPLALDSEHVYTGNIRAWRRMFKVRTEKGVHPDCINLMHVIYQEMVAKIGYPAVVLFNDIFMDGDINEK